LRACSFVSPARFQISFDLLFIADHLAKFPGIPSLPARLKAGPIQGFLIKRRETRAFQVQAEKCEFIAAGAAASASTGARGLFPKHPGSLSGCSTAHSVPLTRDSTADEKIFNNDCPGGARAQKVEALPMVCI